MISEGSCDTKDWDNDVENSALSYCTFRYIKIWKFVFYNIKFYNSTVLYFLYE